jgi:c-di-GMP-binding flagellar brake protein YcgR
LSGGRPGKRAGLAAAELESRMPVERRTSPRYEIFAQIRVRRGRVNYVLDVRNISLTGMFVASESLLSLPAFRVGQILEADLFDPERLDNIRVSGRIVRLVEDAPPQKRGFGVQFSEMEAARRERLRDFVQRAAQRSIVPPPLPGDRGGGRGR